MYMARLTYMPDRQDRARQDIHTYIDTYKWNQKKKDDWLADYLQYKLITPRAYNTVHPHGPKGREVGRACLRAQKHRRAPCAM